MGIPSASAAWCHLEYWYSGNWSTSSNTLLDPFWRFSTKEKWNYINPIPHLAKLTALFTNVQILKFKSQLTIAFFAAVNHLIGPLRKLYFNGFKRSRFVICDWWISIRFVCFCVSRFVACDRNFDWRQRKTQLWKRLLNFRVRMFVKSAVNTRTRTIDSLGWLLNHFLLMV